MSRSVSVCSWAIALGLLTHCAARPTRADGPATPEDAVAAYNASVLPERESRMAPEDSPRAPTRPDVTPTFCPRRPHG